MSNNYHELWAILDFMVPGCLGDASAFHEYYARPIKMGSRSDVSRIEYEKVCPLLP